MSVLLDFKNKITTVLKSYYFQFASAITIGTTTIILLITGVIPPYYLVYTFIMWILVCGLGIAVGYHRVFSHKTHHLPRWKENIIMFLATFAGQGATLLWVSLHRGYHHRLSDREGDIHSPVVHGWFHAFIGWQRTITENTISMKYAVDLVRKSNHIWFHKHHIKVLWSVPLIVAVFDWRLALTAFWLVTMIGVIQDNLINVVGHKKAMIGYRNFDTDDNSHNNFVMGYLGWGQGWHNNHHYAASSYDFGSGVSGKWWEWDPSRIFLPLLK
jgi:fatty-acid desaturase